MPMQEIRRNMNSKLALVLCITRDNRVLTVCSTGKQPNIKMKISTGKYDIQ
jgi:hypothetical protein